MAQGLRELWAVMEQCIDRGPGCLNGTWEEVDQGRVEHHSAISRVFSMGFQLHGHDSSAVPGRLDPSKADTMLPGPLQIRRRAPELYAQDQRAGHVRLGAWSLADWVARQPVMDELRWLNCYALAVMEENACMGRLVTAPTNGAAGVVPAVLAYYMRPVRAFRSAIRGAQAY